ncbi:TIGR03086 family metal-binding protein [Actinokineospora diospyrosa]|uniref:TIGR03086 family protein n=1 Tax=Actinokineospora diospyrosa TaxID=103728 RepID=A0ABT1I9L2_9PSEU|nr:TIGR03086 family metal-binding protein [Actinokineospora diospyrosa]MCP2269323.1 TIGR03086 family protein [Actinokineospora diospyrosa]
MLHAPRDEFRRRLVHVTPDVFGAATPCPDWTVRDLVNHVIGGDQMTVVLLEGGTTEAAVQALGADWIGDDDPVVVFAAAGEALDRAAAVDGVLERVVPHPMGPVPGHQAVSFRVAEYLVHAWDLARALGVDERLDAGLVEQTWEGMRGLAPVIGGLGMFGSGPSGALDENSSPQDRLLDLSGRRP